MDTERFNPANLKPSAARLLHEVTYAATLTDPETARQECRFGSDTEIHVDDEKAGETLAVNAAVDSMTVKDSIIAPLVRALAGRRSGRVKENYQQRSQRAGRKRLQLISDLQEAGRVYLSWRSSDRTFPSVETRPLSPLEVHWSRGPRTLALTPYQVQACGVIEVVRASGRVIGCCSGDYLADQFMRLIIDLSGYGTWKDGARLIGGDFLKEAERETEVPKDWVPLDGKDQLLAVTVLAAWIRMSRLGVLLASADRMGAWRTFFDGTLYGAEIDWLGEVWDEKAKRKTDYELAEPWRAHPEAPWLEDSSGSPVPVVGLAGELLKSAITTVQIVGMVPDDFVIEDETDPDPCYEESNKILIQLKRVYREIAESPIGSVISVDAPELWN